MIWSMSSPPMSVNRESRRYDEIFQSIQGKSGGLLLLTAVALMIGVSGCRHVSEESENRKDTLRVVTTIFPQYDFVRQIAGEHAEVSMLLKPGEVDPFL